MGKGHNTPAEKNVEEKKKFRNFARCLCSSHFILPHKLMVLTDLEVFEVLLGSLGGRHVGMQYEMKFNSYHSMEARPTPALNQE